MTTPTSPLRRPRSLFSLERVRSDKRITWLTVAGLILVPLVIGGLLVWALWNPTERLGDVKAAVVNLDEPATVNGQTVPLGRQLAGGLLDTEKDNFSWVLTDAKDADAGLSDGTYVAVVTIPKNFSRAATSTAGDAAAADQATIDVRTSSTSKLVDPAISQAVTTTATSVLNKQLTSTYLENVYVGFNTLHDQLGQAASGAKSLSGGLTQLASGTQQLADGVTPLASGATALADGTGRLATGASALADGVGQLAGGASSLSGGLSTLSTQTGEFASKLGETSSAAAALPGGIRQVGGAATTAVQNLTTGAQGIGAAAATQCTPAAIATSPQLGALCKAVQDNTPALQTGIGYATGAASGTEQIAAKTDALVGGLQQFASGAQQLAGGAQQSADGAAQLATGAQQSADGASQLASGAEQSASGASQLADGITQLSAGVQPLATGAQQSASGAASLASGLDKAVDQLPNYSSGERTNLASVASQPVTQKASGVEAFGTTSVPLFASVALWLGALATFLVLQAVSRRALLTSRAAGRIALDGLLPGAVLGAIQGVLVSAVMEPAMKLDAGHWFAFAGVAVVVGIAFAAVNHGLTALLGGVGRFVSMLVVVITLASGIVSTAPAFFDGVLPWLPTNAAITALQGVVDGTADVWRGLGGLLLWAALGFALALLAIARRRIVTAAQLLPAE
ncbi:YhgE/Pip domain-containing protein [Leifsonia sp. F6_8S_P_1B]|uniref:YhgE/Pip domain-containing protein n=1 Tax=Leifsonia williamsii TaxID=3035919 RepID=A0ABT8KBT3_9MICO|nr:YhgE/Pip domain-containing protein [Leifsonia williamsii]MDN4614905.1 YhgE/Pip domain-containing protein [Leifsonia williamsii]